jgi:hypothetical protein
MGASYCLMRYFDHVVKIITNNIKFLQIESKRYFYFFRLLFKPENDYFSLALLGPFHSTLGGSDPWQKRFFW